MQPDEGERPSLEVRHRPVQQRGRVRFEAILSAARQLLVERGAEGLTIEDVALRAAIPVGSVYQYFPNKFAVVVELDAQDTAALVAELESSATWFPAADWQAETDRLIDLVSAQWATDPSRNAVWLAMRSNAATQPMADRHSARVVATVLPIVSELNPQLGEDERATVARVVVEMCQSLLHLAATDGRLDPAIVRELKRMLRAYLRAVALEA